VFNNLMERRVPYSCEGTESTPSALRSWPSSSRPYNEGPQWSPPLRPLCKGPFQSDILIGLMSKSRACVGNCALGNECTMLLGLNGQGETRDDIANQVENLDLSPSIIPLAINRSLFLQSLGIVRRNARIRSSMNMLVA
jgi:hypothetical protein